MKIKGYHNIKFLKFIHYTSLLGLVYGFVLIFHGELHWLPFIIATFLISNIGESGALHRYFSHNSFKTGPIRHKLLCFLATLTTQGSIIHWVAMHRVHHKHTDTIDDPISPHMAGFYKSFFGILNDNSFKNANKKIVMDMLRNKDVVWFHNWYWPIIISYIVILLIIDPLLVISCYLMPVGVVRLNFGFNNTVNHGYFKSIGYRNFDSKDMSTNSILFHFLTLLSGESLHNNHHWNSSKYNFQEKWWEFDITGMFIKTVLIK